SIAREGYITYTMSFVSSQETGKLYKIQLAKIPETVSKEEIEIRATPDDAEILVNGQSVGTGSFKEQFSVGEKLIVLVKKEGYEDETMTIEVTKGSGRAYPVTLKKLIKMVPVEITITPPDASILLDRKEVAKGIYNRTHPEGSNLSFLFKRDGYEDQTLNIDVKADTDNTYNVSLTKIKVVGKIKIQTIPADAAILLNDSEVGQGTYSGSYEEGTELAFLIKKDGYEDQTLKVDVVQGPEKTYTVNLKRLMNRVEIRANPPDANIVLDGRVVGRGSYTGSHEVGSRLDFTVKKEGYDDQILTLNVSQTADNTYSVSLNKTIIMSKVQIRTNPPDASIQLNGREVGTGSFSDTYQEGTRLSFTVGKTGYEKETLNITVSGTARNDFTVTLKPMPIESIISLSDSKIVGSITTAGSRIFAVDSHGTLSGVDISGNKLWTVSTQNSPNENSFPVVIGDNVYLSGARELVIVNSSSGKIVSRTPLEGASAHLFGRRVVPFGNQALFPTNDTINLIDLISGATNREIAVLKGSQMTPAVWRNKLVIVDQQGSLLIINPDGKGTVEAEITTSAVQPVALAVTVYDNKALFAGRKGTVVCIDLNRQTVLWEKKLPGSASVFTDIECNSSVVFAYAKGTIYSLSMTSGQDMFDPISAVTSPPLLEGNKLYYGTSGKLVVLNAGNGKPLSSVNTGKASITTKPAVITNKVIAGTDDGKILIMNP
ncbi:MAG: PEGA domain-containing protein, partial [Spirochaetota bacterium]